MGATPQVAGYRQLSAEEVALINKIKAAAALVGDLVDEIAGQSLSVRDGRAVAIAKTELQTGFMWLVRSVAKPESF